MPKMERVLGEGRVVQTEGEHRYGGKKMLQEHLWSKDSKHEV